MKKLFEIIQYTPTHTQLIVEVYDNKYTDSTITIEMDNFNSYLERHDLMDMDSTDDRYSSPHKLSIDEYFEHMPKDVINDDIYKYLSVYHCNYDVAMDGIISDLNKILKSFWA